jgi:uncharacterized protein YaiI (UPF0178 family)
VPDNRLSLDDYEERMIMPTIYIDADACPVKAEAEEIASQGADMADKHIADQAHEGDIVITGDIPLAAKVLGNGAAAIRHNGDIFTSDNIGGQLATRDLMADIRAADPFLVQSGRKGANAAFSAKDRSRFRNALEAEIRKAISSGLRQS